MRATGCWPAASSSNSKILNAPRRQYRSTGRTATDQDAYLNSVALNLHCFYSALERIFELIALELDGGTLGGEKPGTPSCCAR